MPFTTEEVADAVQNVQSRKAAGSDELLAEHLNEGGGTLWPIGIFDAVVDIEVVSDVLECDTVVPVYEGGGKDPLIATEV